MDLELGATSYRIASPAAIEEPASRWDLERGYVFPVERDGRTVGMVFVGEGRWTTRFERPGDARIAANRLAILERVPADALSATVHDQARVDPFDRGYLLGHDVWDAIGGQLVPVDPGHLVVAPADDAAEEILVVDDRGSAAARRLAERVLHERIAWHERSTFDPGSLLQADLVQTADLHTRFGEFATAQTWDRFAGTTALGTASPWLTYLRDPSGAASREDRAQVYAQSVNDGVVSTAVVARERFPTDVDGVRRAPHRVDLGAASVTVTWDREGSGASLVDRVASVMRLTAVGGEARLVWLDVPHVEQQPFGADPAMPHGYTLESIHVDGVPIEAVHLPLTGAQRDGRGQVRTYAIRLPRPVPAAEAVDLTVVWRDRHRYSHVGGPPVGQFKGTTLHFEGFAGVTTLPVRVLPRVRTHAGSAAPVRLRVGVRPWVADRDKIALSGARSAPFRDGGYRYVEALTHSVATTVIVGQWTDTAAPPALDFPGVRSLLRSQGSEVSTQLPVEVRSVLNGWRGLLPSYPAAEVQLAELYAGSQLALWLGGDGVAAIQPVTSFRTGPRSGELRLRRIVPHYERWAVSAALHAHWWAATGLPPGAGDLARTVSTVYGVKTLGARFGPEVEDTWWDLVRVASRTADRDLDEYWPEAFALGRMLTDEIGDAALLEAVDRTLSGEFPPTVDGLHAALEATSGRELDAFFELWIDSALAPRVDASWRATADGAEITLTTDLPFATFDVPVRLSGRRETRDVRITVRDGRGVAVVPFDTALRTVQVDPESRVLLARADSL